MTQAINFDLLRRIPADAKVVLEVGCGSGNLAEAYRRINPDVRYLGIEKDAEASRLAKSSGQLDRVAVGDACEVAPSDLGLSEPGSKAEPVVNCLVFADALEHMIDPWGALARLSGWVCKGGQVLACIPNMQHYSVLVNLMRGRWEYNGEWPPERLDLRFFTLSAIQDLFARAGLQIFEIVPRWRPDTEFDRFQRMMEPVVRDLGIDAKTFAFQTRATEYLVRAVRAADTPRRMVIWSLLGSAIGSEVRIGEPGTFLAAIPGVRVLADTSLQIKDLDQTWPGEERIFLQQRVIIPLEDHLRLQRRLLDKGYLIVGEFDDDPAHFAMLEHTNFLALRGCHCLQTTNELMAESLRPYNPHVMVFPNQVAALPPPRPADRTDSGQVTILFAALNREADWAPILAVLDRVLAAHGERARIQVVHDRAFFDALRTRYKEFAPLCSYDRYNGFLNTADIALLPLAPSRFNRHKSDLKYIECAAQGAVALASPTVYNLTIRHGETGLIYHSADEFAALLDRLIQDVPFRRRLAHAAYCYVAERRLLSRHFRDRYDWYRAMLSRREQLDAELRRRLPELSVP